MWSERGFLARRRRRRGGRGGSPGRGAAGRLRRYPAASRRADGSAVPLPRSRVMRQARSRHWKLRTADMAQVEPGLPRDGRVSAGDQAAWKLDEGGGGDAGGGPGTCSASPHWRTAGHSRARLQESRPAKRPRGVCRLSRARLNDRERSRVGAHRLPVASLDHGLVPELRFSRDKDRWALP